MFEATKSPPTRHPAILFADHHRPDVAGDFIGQGHGGDHARFAPNELLEPAVGQDPFADNPYDPAHGADEMLTLFMCSILRTPPLGRCTGTLRTRRRGIHSISSIEPVIEADDRIYCRLPSLEGRGVDDSSIRRKVPGRIYGLLFGSLNLRFGT